MSGMATTSTLGGSNPLGGSSKTGKLKRKANKHKRKHHRTKATKRGAKFKKPRR